MSGGVAPGVRLLVTLALVLAACARAGGGGDVAADTTAAPPGAPAPADPVAAIAREASPPAATGGDTLPLVVVTRPSVIAVWAVPPDSLIESDEWLSTRFDDFMYYLSESRPRLDSLGIEEHDQPLAWRDRRLRVRAGADTWTVGIGDSLEVGYVFAAPGRAPRVHEGMLFDEDLADSLRAHFGRPPR